MTSVPQDFCCAATGQPLYLPVITTHGVAYSYSALLDMFMKAQGVPTCKVTQEPILFMPAVCLPLHHFLMAEYKTALKSRKQVEEFEMMDKFGLKAPQVKDTPDEDGDAGFLEEFQCVVSGALAYEPCALSSGSIVSSHCVPEGGFQKDPDRLVACALHGQAPRKSACLEAMIRAKFPAEYKEREMAVSAGSSRRSSDQAVCRDFDAQEHVHFGLGCDGCGLWPIRGKAWEDADCKEKVGFHLCDACYTRGYHKRVIGGRFNQGHMPKNRMAAVHEGIL
ncbi:unnamed protein product [Polarella glacialis]|uniref:ZZ-type domain-containing protein n=1 Tax=Polarella glacialis TaxID=89957 RepID=A0A813HLE0_POLGL|nr:unnamed protein product [Polarella glacialis]